MADKPGVLGLLLARRWIHVLDEQLGVPATGSERWSLRLRPEAPPLMPWLSARSDTFRRWSAARYAHQPAL